MGGRTAGGGLRHPNRELAIGPFPKTCVLGAVFLLLLLLMAVKPKETCYRSLHNLEAPFKAAPPPPPPPQSERSHVACLLLFHASQPTGCWTASLCRSSLSGSRRVFSGRKPGCLPRRLRRWGGDIACTIFHHLMCVVGEARPLLAVCCRTPAIGPMAISRRQAVPVLGIVRKCSGRVGAGILHLFFSFLFPFLSFFFLVGMALACSAARGGFLVQTRSLGLEATAVLPGFNSGCNA